MKIIYNHEKSDLLCLLEIQDDGVQYYYPQLIFIKYMGDHHHREIKEYGTKIIICDHSIDYALIKRKKSEQYYYARNLGMSESFRKFLAVVYNYGDKTKKGP